MSGEADRRRPAERSAENERRVIGSIIRDAAVIDEVSCLLNPEDFRNTRLRSLYSLLLGMSSRGDPIDLVTVAEAAERAGLAVPADYLASLTDDIGSGAAAAYYAGEVKTGSVRRACAAAAETLVAASADVSLTPEEVLEQATRTLYAVQAETGDDYRRACDLVPGAVKRMEDAYNAKGALSGIAMGFSEIDQVLSGLQDSEFIVIGARPSIGKTAFALSAAANIAIRGNIPVGFFSLEMSHAAIMQRLLSAEARVDSARIRSGRLKPSDFHNLTEAAGRIYEAPLYIADTPNMHILKLRAQARKMVARDGVRVVFVDYISLITPENRKIDRHEQIAEVSRALKALARELEIPVVALSQVGRQAEGRRPTMADIRESGSIEQDADVVIFLHRERAGDEESPVVETVVDVAKQRNGPTGERTVSFHRAYTRFDDFDRRTSGTECDAKTYGGSV